MSESELAFAVAHEVRNALAVISALSFAGEHAPDAETFAKIRAQCVAAEKVVSDVLALATTPLPRSPCRVSEALELVQMPSVTLTGDAVVMAHSGLLARIFSVLIENASAVFAEMRMRITVQTVGEVVSIQVEDNGPGVPAGLAVFEAGVSGRGSTGLGLGFALRIARAHGGDLQLVPSSSGASTSGATFVLTLPLASLYPRASL
jgi:signal transduction histidine kinase